ncbi:MAG TPA: VC0807 family protein, partial [Chloroflexota bacterium]|nr:VC0807 family protein [Chloroflexota bacterium]
MKQLMLSGPGGSAFRVGLALNVLAPFVAYQVMSRLGVGPVPALAAAAVLPLAGTVRGWVRSGRLDVTGGLALLFIALGIVVAVATDNPLVLLLKGSVVNAAYAVLCLASLLWRRPLLFYVGRQFATSGDRAAMERYDGLWEAPVFRASQRRATVVWAL